MIRAVLDCNVLVSGFPRPGSIPRRILEQWARNQFELILSDHILSEVADAWNKTYFLARYTRHEAQQAIATLRVFATIVVPVTTVRGVADDEEDDYVLATAVAGNATHLVTGDRGLLRLGSYQGVVILTPRDFLDLLTAANSPTST